MLSQFKDVYTSIYKVAKMAKEWTLPSISIFLGQNNFFEKLTFLFYFIFSPNLFRPNRSLWTRVNMCLSKFWNSDRNLLTRLKIDLAKIGPKIGFRFFFLVLYGQACTTDRTDLSDTFFLTHFMLWLTHSLPFSQEL